MMLRKMPSYATILFARQHQLFSRLYIFCRAEKVVAYRLTLLFAYLMRRLRLWHIRFDGRRCEIPCMTSHDGTPSRRAVVLISVQSELGLYPTLAHHSFTIIYVDEEHAHFSPSLPIGIISPFLFSLRRFLYFSKQRSAYFKSAHDRAPPPSTTYFCHLQYPALHNRYLSILYFSFASSHAHPAPVDASIITADADICRHMK